MAGLFKNTSDPVVFADGAFHNPLHIDFLQRLRHIRVWATPRKDTKTPWPDEFRRLATRLRRHIETALSVLVTVFNIERPAAHSLSGCVARIATRIFAYILAFITGPFLARLNR